MAKIGNIIGKYLLRLIEWSIIFLFLFLFAVRTPTFQTLLGEQATNYLSKELGHKISIGRIDVPYYNRLTLTDVYAEDVNNDTLLNVGTIKAELRFFSMSLNVITLKNIVLKEGQVYLKRDAENGKFNFQYLVDFFTPKEKKKKRKFKFKVEDIGLANVHFKLDDERKERKTFGVDYAHLDANNVYVSLHNVSLKGTNVSAFIKHISLREKSGFVLSKLTSDFSLTQKGMFFDDLKLITPSTSAFLPKLHFNMDSLNRFKTFVDDVDFDAQLAYSNLSMKDVSYFAPRLKGMDEIVRVEAKVTQRIKDLSIQNFRLDVREKTTVQGDFNLPDFRDLTHQSIDQLIRYAYVDVDELNRVKLPLGDEEAKTLNLTAIVQRFGHAEINHLATNGTIRNLSIKANTISTDVGKVEIPNWIYFKSPGDGKVHFSLKEEGKITFDEFNLGKLIENSLFGTSSGEVALKGDYSKEDGIFLDSIFGNVSHFAFKGYNYQSVQVINASYFDKKVNGKIISRDKNADFEFNGSIDANTQQAYVATVQLNHVELNRLNLIESDSLFVVDGLITTDIKGEDEYTYRGIAQLESFCLMYGSQEFHTENARLSLLDEGEVSLINLQSDILDGNIRGAINFKNVIHDMMDILSIAIPLMKEEENDHDFSKNNFNYSLNLKNVNPILSMFYPNIYISNGTKVFGAFDSDHKKLDLTVQSPQLKIGALRTNNINFSNTFSQKGAELRYVMSEFYLNDSLSPFESFLFVSTGTTDSLKSYAKWGKPNKDLSNIRWESTFRSWDDFTFNVDKSLFTLNTHDWRLPRPTEITYNKGNWLINDFELLHDEQFITIDGEYSTERGKSLNICVSNLDLTEVTGLFSLDVNAKGIANGEFHLANNDNVFQLFGTSSIEDFVLNDAEVGSFNVLGNWDNSKKAINLVGDLSYKNTKTFNIYGDYYTDRKKDNLDFILDFDNTKIDFINAFVDPKVVSNIRGNLTGKAKVKGELNNPLVTGDIKLKNGNAKVGMFGVNYGFDGLVQIDNDLIFFDNLPLLDENGNRGMLTGSILHDHFKDFNFDVFIGLDDVVSKDGKKNASFLAMNTKYQEGTLYYGKAYVNGWVGISGYLDNMNIEVNLKTRKNSSIVIPLYGAEEIDDILSYHIHHVDTLSDHSEDEVKSRNLRLNLNFDITPDALIRLVFDEQTEEEIAATGAGKISMMMSNEIPLSMDGNYIINDGHYNFVYSPIRKQFLVEKGSSVSWSGGGPLDADLNIKATYKVNTDISAISPELESKASASSVQNVDAIIDVRGDLDQPQLAFGLNAPAASESVKAALDRINNDSDELNKQFFMLLLTGHFQSTGIAGIGNGGANAALEALSGQINNLLDAVSKDVRLNVDLRSDDLSGKNSQAIGFKTNLLDNKLIIKGNFGVENNATAADERSTSFIGDLSVEYVIDKSGNFRVKAFNESNSYSAIQDKELGMFTQGIGLVYSESFNKFREANFVNFIADIFRKDKYFQYTKRRQRKLLPELKDGGE